MKEKEFTENSNFLAIDLDFNQPSKSTDESYQRSDFTLLECIRRISKFLLPFFIVLHIYILVKNFNSISVAIENSSFSPSKRNGHHNYPVGSLKLSIFMDKKNNYTWCTCILWW